MNINLPLWAYIAYLLAFYAGNIMLQIVFKKKRTFRDLERQLYLLWMAIGFSIVLFAGSYFHNKVDFDISARELEAAQLGYGELIKNDDGVRFEWKNGAKINSNITPIKTEE